MLLCVVLCVVWCVVCCVLCCVVLCVVCKEVVLCVNVRPRVRSQCCGAADTDVWKRGC